MEINGKNVTSQAQGNFNTVGAAAGIASLLGVDLGSILGSRYNPGMSADALIAALASTKNGSNDTMISALISAIVSLIPQMTNHGTCSESQYVNRYEMTMQQELAAKDAKLALWEAKDEINNKMIDLTKYIDGKVEALDGKFQAYKDAQAAKEIEQASLNATQASAISCMKQQIAQINADYSNLTKNYVPSYNVCQQNCCGYNNGCTGAQVVY